MLLRLDSQLVEESVMPDLLHIIPRSHNSVLNRVFQCQNTSLRLSLISNIGVLLSHSHHHSLMSRSSHNRWEDSSWCVISGKSCLDHTTSVVDNQSLGILTLFISRIRHIDLERCY